MAVQCSLIHFHNNSQYKLNIWVPPTTMDKPTGRFTHLQINYTMCNIDFT